ncbi:hypothetical protein RIR_jg23201.t1 [Rhizophagus irregularis DAOM 181602=DAOM 197198]|nr:hypothetical protein RIR_jg23201.t1 [Rhizophagus irregularis DAOM 181602=DAOM 197198]
MIVGARGKDYYSAISAIYTCPKILPFKYYFQFCRASDGTPDQKQRLASDIKKSTLPKDNSSPHSFGRHFL